MEVATTDRKIVELQQQVDNLSKKVDVYHEDFMSAVTKKKKPSGDENEERGNWTHKFDFFLSCLGYAVGLGNVWRFPYLCYKNGGGAFFIPYCIMLAIVGIPIFFMELSLGQFSSMGPATCWSFARLFRGIGCGMVIVSALVAIYYNMIIGWAFYYLFASFTAELPWVSCVNKDWGTQNCSLEVFKDASGCTDMNLTVYDNGTCADGNDTVVGIWNETMAWTSMYFKRKLPTQEYLERVALGSAYSEDIGDLGPIRWQLLLCYLLAWIFVCATLSKGVKSSGKVVYFTATFPYVVLIILFVRGILLEGAYDGIMFYITPNLDKLSDANVWKDAAVQIFFSLSASWGGLIALSSYNKFHNDCFRDAIIVSFGNCLTSFFAGFVIFSYLGFLANDMDIDIDKVADKGPTLAFVVYPFAVTKLPISTLWSILFFIMLVTLGVDSQFVLVETVTTSFMDVFPKARNFKAAVVFGFGVIFFLLGLTLTTNGGVHMLDLMDYYSGGWNVLVIALCECIALGYVYGVKRFLKDIETMVGQKVCGIFPWVIWKYWWAACWCFLTPLGVTFILIYSWVKYTRLDSQPQWADALGWGMTLVVILAIFIPGLISICQESNKSLGDRIKALTTPTVEWGPALPKYRALVARYVPNFVIDPKGKEDVENGNINKKGDLNMSYIPDDEPNSNSFHLSKGDAYDSIDQRL